MLDPHEIIKILNDENIRLQMRVAKLEAENEVLRHNYELRRTYQRNLMRQRRAEEAAAKKAQRAASLPI